jgi:hypothetical protein
VGSSIWPGPECSKTRDLQPGDCVVLLAFKSPTRGLTMYPPMRLDVGKVATVTSLALPGFEPNGCVEVKAPGMMPWWWPACALADARSLGIAMALEAARRRERFARWLKPLMFHEYAWARAKRFAGTPEAFVMRCDWHDLRVLMACAEFEPESMPTQKAVRLALLASDTWLSLPWQRDPSEVSRG